MPDDTALLMPLETAAGTVADLPPELTPEPRPTPGAPSAEPAAPATTPAAAVVAEPAPPAPVAPSDWQTERAGILRELSETRTDRQASRQEVARLTGMLETIQKQMTPPAATVVVPTGPSAQEIEDTARTLGLYKADGSGQLDLKMASAVLAREQARAEAVAKRIVEEQVAPLQQHVQAQQAEKGRGDIFAVMRQAGVEDRFTEAAIANITGGDPKLLGDVGVQTMVTLAAAGLQQLTGSKKTIAPAAVTAATTAAAAAMGTAATTTPVPAAPTAPAPFVPDTGARPATATAPELTALEKKAMRTHGIKPAEYTAFTAPLDRANETGRIPAGGFPLEE